MSNLWTNSNTHVNIVYNTMTTAYKYDKTYEAKVPRISMSKDL
jgi:hypothetical protein